MITTALNDQNHISENCIGSVIFDWSPIRLHGEGGVYDLYCSQPPGGDQRARRFTFPDMWGTPASIHVNSLTVTVCLPLPLSPHPYMVLPVSQSLLVQSVSALCLDYVPGVSSYVSLYKSVLPHVTCGLLLMSACKPVSMFVPVFLCLLRLSFIKYPVCYNPRLLVPGSPCAAPWH